MKISNNPYDSTLSFTAEQWETLLREAKHIAWCKGRDAAAAVCDQQSGLSNNPLHLATMIRALPPPYENQKPDEYHETWND